MQVSVPYLVAGLLVVWMGIIVMMYVNERRSAREDEAAAAVFLATAIVLVATAVTGLIVGVSAAIQYVAPVFG